MKKETEETRKAYHLASLKLDVLVCGFSEALKREYSPEGFTLVLELMNEMLPPVIDLSEKAQEAYLPLRSRFRRRRSSASRSRTKKPEKTPTIN